MSDYTPPNVEDAGTDLPVPPRDYTEPDVEGQDVGPVDPPEYVGPFIHDDEPAAKAKGKAAEPAKKAAKK